MSQKPYDILAVGNAIVDVFAECDENFLYQYRIKKGGMNLIDANASQNLLDAISKITRPRLISGGSAANTAVGLAMLGGRASFVGRAREDDLGRAFRSDIRSSGVEFSSNLVTGGPPTASSIILVTPDAARSMNTFLGASVEFQPGDIDFGAVSDAAIVYLEGYLFDAPSGPAIFEKMAKLAQKNQTRLALSLSDAWCVDRHHSALKKFIIDHVDILFANEDEAESLAGSQYPESVGKLSGFVDEVVVTRGSLGAVICYAGQQFSVDAMPQGSVVDTTGAGDFFAAGYLYGRTKEKEPGLSGRIASLVAGEVISHIGARPKSDLKKIIQSV